MSSESFGVFVRRQRCLYMRDPNHPIAIVFENGAYWINEVERFDPPTIPVGVASPTEALVFAKNVAIAQLKYVNAKLTEELRDFENFKHASMQGLTWGKYIGNAAQQLAEGASRIGLLQRRKASLEELTGDAEERRVREAAEERKRLEKEEYDRQLREMRQADMARLTSICVSSF